MAAGAGGPASAADGAFRPTFSGDGRRSPIGSAERADGVAVQPDGRIVVAGTGCGGDCPVARYDACGALDPTFSGDGHVFVDLGVGADDRGVDVLVLAEGRLLVAGTSAGNFALVRFMVGETPIPGCIGLPGPTPGQSVAIAVARALPDGAPDAALPATARW